MKKAMGLFIALLGVIGITACTSSNENGKGDTPTPAVKNDYEGKIEMPEDYKNAKAISESVNKIQSVDKEMFSTSAMSSTSTTTLMSNNKSDNENKLDELEYALTEAKHTQHMSFNCHIKVMNRWEYWDDATEGQVRLVYDKDNFYTGFERYANQEEYNGTSYVPIAGKKEYRRYYTSTKSNVTSIDHVYVQYGDENVFNGITYQKTFQYLQNCYFNLAVVRVSDIDGYHDNGVNVDNAYKVEYNTTKALFGSNTTSMIKDYFYQIYDKTTNQVVFEQGFISAIAYNGEYSIMVGDGGGGWTSVTICNNQGEILFDEHYQEGNANIPANLANNNTLIDQYVAFINGKIKDTAMAVKLYTHASVKEGLVESTLDPVFVPNDVEVELAGTITFEDSILDLTKMELIIDAGEVFTEGKNYTEIGLRLYESNVTARQFDRTSATCENGKVIINNLKTYNLNDFDFLHKNKYTRLEFRFYTNDGDAILACDFELNEKDGKVYGTPKKLNINKNIG